MRFILLIGAVLTAVAFSAVYAADGQAPELKWRAMTELAAHLDENLQHRHPAATRVTIYGDVRVPDFRLERLTVWLDDERVAARRYTADQARALLSNALDRVLRTDVEPGEHVLRMRFRGRRLSGAFEGETADGEVRIRFRKTDRAMALIVPVAPGGLRPDSPWRVQVWTWHDAPTDARLGYVRYLRGTGRRFEALLELLEIRGAGDADPPAGYHGLLAHSLLDHGMRERAQQALQRAADAGRDRHTRNRAVLRLAALQWRHGARSDALATLDAVAPHLTPRQDRRRRELWSRILIAQDKPAAALSAITDGREPPTPIMRYNRAVALDALGRSRAARELLADIGTRAPGEGLAPTVQDRANLTLGYRYSRAGRRSAARLALVRVRPDGPYAARALLALAWNAIASGADDDGPRVRYAGLDFGPEKNDVAQALHAWAALHQPASLSEVAREAAAARAVVLAAHDGADAADVAANTVASLERRRGILDDAALALRAGQRPETVTAEDFGALAAAPWLARLRAAGAFRRARADYRDFERLRQALTDAGVGEPSLARALESAAGDAVSRGQTALAVAVARQRRRTARWLVSVRLALARLYESERAGEAAQPSKSSRETSSSGDR